MTREPQTASSPGAAISEPVSAIESTRKLARGQQRLKHTIRNLVRATPDHNAAEHAAAVATSERWRTQVRGRLGAADTTSLSINDAFEHVAARPVVIYGTSVTSKWFKDVWIAARGAANPVVAFVDAFPSAPFRRRCDEVLVLSPETFWARGFEGLGRPYVLLSPEDVTAGLADELAQRGLQPRVDLSVYANAPDYTIDRIAPYASWDQAMADSASYEDPVNIAEHIEHARQARTGDGAKHLGYADQRLLAPFAAIDGGASSALRVIDFGGGLGLHQHRLKQLMRNRRFDWTVWETPAMAAAGNEHFASHELRFCSDVRDIPRPIDLTLASGTLQYVGDPADYFRKLSGLGSRFVLFDRLPLTPWAEDRLVVQRVHRVTPNGRFSTSYPSYFLSESKWMQRFCEAHDVVMQWSDASDVVMLDGTEIVFSGVLLERRTCRTRFNNGPDFA
jgi:putative methyltransferase (TIGR04325 family)